MASPELQRILEICQNMVISDIYAMRAESEQLPPYPKPDDILWEQVDAAGVEAEWNVPADCEPGRVVEARCLRLFLQEDQRWPGRAESFLRRHDALSTTS